MTSDKGVTLARKFLVPKGNLASGLGTLHLTPHRASTNMARMQYRHPGCTRLLIFLLRILPATNEELGTAQSAETNSFYLPADRRCGLIESVLDSIGFTLSKT
jgi:hypothetical protein